MLQSLLAIGGVSVILAELHRVIVVSTGWMSETEFASLFALAQAAPGPNMLFVTLIGWSMAGITGAIHGHPAEGGYEIHQPDDVLALEIRVLDVGQAAALAEAPLVEAQDAESRVQPRPESAGTGRAAAPPAVGVQHHRHGVARTGAGGLVQRVADVDRRRAARLGHALDTSVGHRWFGGGHRHDGGQGEPDRQDRGAQGQGQSRSHR
ncbi:MAG: chromate transporter [Actinobacteria bacterium]|nr:chromate transporter [Actinomycetota bacterium]